MEQIWTAPRVCMNPTCLANANQAPPTINCRMPYTCAPPTFPTTLALSLYFSLTMFICVFLQVQLECKVSISPQVGNLVKKTWRKKNEPSKEWWSPVLFHQLCLLLWWVENKERKKKTFLTLHFRYKLDLFTITLLFARFIYRHVVVCYLYQFIFIVQWMETSTCEMLRYVGLWKNT